MNSFIYTVFFGLLFFSCESQKSQQAVKKSHAINITKSTFHLPAPDGVSNSISNYSVYKDNLYLFDNYKYRLIEVNLETKDVILHDFVNKLRDQVQFVSKFKVLDNNSLILFDGMRLFVSDFGGNISQQYNIFENIENLWNEGVYSEYPTDNISHELVFNKNNNAVIFYFANSSELKKKNVFGEFSLTTGKWSVVNATHPSYYDGVPFNYTTFPSVLIDKDTLAFIYTISPIVSIVDLQSHKQTDFIIESFPGKQFAEPQTERDSWSEEYFGSWILNSPSYYKLLYDENRKLFYRLSSPSLNQENVENAEAVYVANSHVYLTILDQHLTILENIKLEKGKYNPKSSFVFRNGLWIGYNEGHIPDEKHIYGDFFEHY